LKKDIMEVVAYRSIDFDNVEATDIESSDSTMGTSEGAKVAGYITKATAVCSPRAGKRRRLPLSPEMTSKAYDTRSYPNHYIDNNLDNFELYGFDPSFDLNQQQYLTLNHIQHQTWPLPLSPATMSQQQQHHDGYRPWQQRAISCPPLLLSLPFRQRVLHFLQ
jgi:hypothetical protein